MMRHPLSYTLFPYTTLFRSEEDNTIVVFTTDNGTEVFTWPDGGQTPFAQSKGTIMEGGFHDRSLGLRERRLTAIGDRKSTRLNSSHPSISYAVFCLQKKKPQ